MTASSTATGAGGASRPMRSRRACLAVPGASERMLAKAHGIAVDQVVLDLEDAVDPTSKALARQRVVAALTADGWTAPTRSVRVNDCTSTATLRDLEAVVLGAGAALHTVIVPKVDEPGHVAFVDLTLAQLEAEAGLATGTIGMEVQVESPRSLLALGAILTASPRIEAVLVGFGDLASTLALPTTTIGATQPGYPGDSWHHVRWEVLVHARAHGVQAISGPYSAIRDLEGTRAMADLAHAAGFDGTWVVHPDQIAPALAAFQLDLEEFERAVDLLDAYAAAIADRRGAARFRDQMIDEASRRMALVLQARGLAQGLTARPTPDDVAPEDRAAWRRAATGGAADQ